MAPRPPTKARQKTAYDVGRTGATPPPEWIGGNADLLAAYDQGLAASEDPAGAPAPAAGGTSRTASAPPAAARVASASTTPATPASSSTPTQDASRSSSSRPDFPAWSTRKPPGLAGDGTGLLLGLVAYSVGLCFLRDGKAGVHAWFAAKFLNKVTASPSKGGSW